LDLALPAAQRHAAGSASHLISPTPE